MAQAQRRLSKKKKGTANFHKARIKVARIQAKIADCRRDFTHKTHHYVDKRKPSD
ncbi:transposase [Vibrio harveyi]|uniref:transposase n=1 Tax=Vibrio harveyi TaxID=669 RepID=UPI00217CE49E|nr:transposase [Vibrio harveyi]